MSTINYSVYIADMVSIKNFLEELLMQKLNLTQEWDKTFAQSSLVDHTKVTFDNSYGFTLAADLYKPKDLEGKLPAIAVAGPYGAVKEQSSGLYAQTMAGKGYLTLAFDPSFTGESSGSPRNTTSPEINTEDYSAAIDYLVSRSDVDEDKLAIIGICGWGGMALSAAYADPRIKVTVASTTANLNAEAGQNRSQTLQYIAAQRTAVAKGVKAATMLSVPEEINDETPQPLKDFYHYYRNPERGYHPRSINSGIAVSPIATRGFVHFSMFDYIGEIENAVLMVHGENAVTYPAGKALFEQLTGDNKEFYTVPNAIHTDLYDQVDKIPFAKIDEFIKRHLSD